MDAPPDDWLALEPAPPPALPVQHNGTADAMYAELAALKRQLSPAQRAYVNACVEHGFSPKKALETLHKDFPDLHRNTVARWRRQAAVRRALEVAEELALAEANVSATRVLRRLDDIAERCAEDMPLTFKGLPVVDDNGQTIQVMKDATAALKANELLGKRLRLWGEDETAGKIVVQLVNLTGEKPVEAVPGEFEHVA